ncbi:MAG: TolC family protein [bacterium]|nr:TolC family protein [bacterium]
MHPALPAVALALASVATACSLAPRAATTERQRAEAAGGAWIVPRADRHLPALPLAPGWRDVVGRALVANGELEAAYREWQAALARIDAAAAYPNTNVSVGFEYLVSGQGLSAWDRTTLEFGFDPMQNLAFPTKVLAAGEIALAEARAAGERFAAARFALKRRVLTTWWQHALAGERVRLAYDAQALARLAVATARAATGAGAQAADAVTADAALLEAGAEIGRLEAERTALRATLNALVLRAADTPLDPPATLPAPRPLPVPDGRGIAGNPGLRALAHDLAGREHALDLAWQQIIPDVNPFVGLTGSMERAAGVVLSIPVRIPLIRAGIAEARAMLSRAEALRDQAGHDRDADLVATLAALHDADRRATLWSERIVPALAQAAATRRAAYAAEAGGLGDLLDAERAVVDARLLAAELHVARETRLAELEELVGADAETLAGGAS